MTEREQFEKVFPVPEGAVWWDVIEAYCRKNKTTVHQYNDKWQAWQAARATPALPQGVEEWISRNQFDAYGSDPWGGPSGYQTEAVPVSDLRAYLSGMAIVPVECLEIAERAIHLLQFNTSKSSQDYDAITNALNAVLAATKEKGE